jgi:YgiT-type zinc finger domain-containing protein
MAGYEIHYKQGGLLNLNCELCKGQLADKMITYARWDHSPFIVENVPAKVCMQCGGELLTPPILDAIKKIISEKKPRKHQSVPVFDLSEVDTGDVRLISPEYHPDSKCVFHNKVDLRSLKKMLQGKTESKVWVKGVNNLKHPDEETLRQLKEAFSSPPDEPIQNIVDGTEDGYILYELRGSILNDRGEPVKLPVAKMTYIGKQNIWQLYWIWRSGIWQEYGAYPELNQVVEQIKEDKLRFCA